MYNAIVPGKFTNLSPYRMGKPFIQIYACLIFVLFLWTAYCGLKYPLGLNYGEAPLMDQARRIEDNQTLYKADVNEPPYVIANYPPLFPVLVAALNSVVNIPVFQAGRAISLFSALACAVVIGYFGYHLTENKILGILSISIFLGNPYVLVWSSLARVDMMALAFSLLGLWAVYQSRYSKKSLILAVVFFLISIFTRQTYVLAGPLAASLWLWFEDKRRALLFVVALGVATFLIFGMINASTHGGFYLNIITANINQFSISRTIQMLKQFAILWPVILVGSFISILIASRSLVQKKESDSNPHESLMFMVLCLGVYGIASFITALTVGKVGSDINYFLELIAICSIWCVIGVKYLLAQKNGIKFTFLGLLAAQVIWTIIAAIFLTGSMFSPKTGSIQRNNALLSIVKNAAQKGIVLSDDYLDLVVLSGQSIYYQPFEYGQLYQAGLWNPSRFIQEINQGAFSLILIGGDTLNKPCCWPPPVVSAIEDNYLVSRDANKLVLTLK